MTDLPDPLFDNPRCVLVIKTGERNFYASFTQNRTSEELIRALAPTRVRLELRCDAPTAEGKLPFALSLPEERLPFTASAGQIVLREGNLFTVCFGEVLLRGVPVAEMGEERNRELRAALEDRAEVEICLEWGE